MESDTMILLLITISLIVVVVYNQFIKCDKENDKDYKRKGHVKGNYRGYDKEEFRNFNNSKKVSVMSDSLGDNSINKKDLYKYNKIYRKNICLDNKNKKKYKKKIEIVENEINSLDNLLNNDMKSLNNIDNNTLSDIETFVK
jgi:hypothetical protein